MSIAEAGERIAVKAEMANQLLSSLLDMGDDLDEVLAKLQAHATWKWDRYEGFRVGRRFLESLARWLQQFEDIEMRRRWVNFVLNDLIFISAQEIDHAVETAYETELRPFFVRRAAALLEVAPHRTATITASTQFKEVQRRTLILGLSDGARLDQLRRSNNELSHEQYAPSIHLDNPFQQGLLTKLNDALTRFGSTADRTFSHAVLVDDFYGSGTSLLKRVVDNPKRPVAGKIGKFCGKFVRSMADTPAAQQLFADDFSATILLYAASEQAVTHIRTTLQEVGLSHWELVVMQTISASCRVTDPTLIEDCRWFWDPVLEDDHKGNSHLGYKDCALPLVLHHNAPNNSVCPLWADSAGRPDGKNRHALFPRYERHHQDRP
ncbi:hypothetical protein [Mycolicibacterium wolinskyi]|nr:hypothetical protein [Mycolicibacterium wolinskyi]